MAFGGHAREYFLIGLFGSLISIWLAVLFQGSWLQVAGWLGLIISAIWCIGPGHGIVVVGGFLDRLRKVFRGKQD